MKSPHDQIAFLAQKQGDLRNPECFLNDRTHASQQVFKLHHCSALLRDDVNGFELPSSLALQ